MLGTDMHGVGDGVTKTSQLFLISSTQQPWGLTGMFTTIHSNPFFKKSSKPLGVGNISTFEIGTDMEEFPGQEGPFRQGEHH